MKEKIKYINQSIDKKKERLSDIADNNFTKLSEDINNKKCQVCDINTDGRDICSKDISSKKQNESDDFDKHNKLNEFVKVIKNTSSMIANRSQRLKKPKSISPSLLVLPDLMPIKNDVVSKGIALVKNVTREWDEFMESNQKELFSAIDSISLSVCQKDELSSKIFSYEVIDINLSDLMSMINKACSLPEINENLEEFKEKLISAIETTTNKQIAKYNSLLEV